MDGRQGSSAKQPGDHLVLSSTYPRACLLDYAISYFQTSAMAKELEAVHEEMEEREVQMAALTKALSEAGVGLR